MKKLIMLAGQELLERSQRLVIWILNQYGMIHQKLTLFAEKNPTGAAVTIEILAVMAFLFFIIKRNQKAKAAAPEAAKLSKTTVTMSTDWKAVRHVCLMAFLVLIAVGWVLSKMG